jgi:hypothetical protein
VFAESGHSSFPTSDRKILFLVTFFVLLFASAALWGRVKSSEYPSDALVVAACCSSLASVVAGVIAVEKQLTWIRRLVGTVTGWIGGAALVLVAFAAIYQWAHDEHPLVLTLYLIGSAAGAITFAVLSALGEFVSWMTKTNILERNLKKLTRNDDATLITRTLFFIGLLLVAALFSWVFVLLWLSVSVFGILFALRDVFESKPEAVKKCRYALKNNPHLSREAVWAYSIALDAANGQPMIEGKLIAESLNNVRVNHDDFNGHAAVQFLRTFYVVEPHVLDSAIERFYELSPR